MSSLKYTTLANLFSAHRRDVRNISLGKIEQPTGTVTESDSASAPPKAFPIQARRRCGVCREPIQHYVIEQFIAGKHIFRMAIAVGPGPELFQYPGELPSRRVDEPVANRLWPRTLLLGVA